MAELNEVVGDPITTDDLYIRPLKPIPSPVLLHRELPASTRAADVVRAARSAAREIVDGQDGRLLAVVGPCSIHDVTGAEEYADRLAKIARRLADDLLLVMRVYFEKPRTVIGWKGLINDPRLDGSFDVGEGLRRARRLLCRIGDIGVPAGCEFLDPLLPQYFAALVSWGAIGARTTESQIHRALASGLGMPMGFKNGTDGNLQIAIDAVRAAAHRHHSLGITRHGIVGVMATSGNPDCHVILRGSHCGANYDRACVAAAAAALGRSQLRPRLMIDCSHGNSGNDFSRQPSVAEDLAQQIESGSRAIFGVILESHLESGRQELAADRPPRSGQSITDGCLGWAETVPVLERLAAAVRARRSARR